jgi:hypothetical protein
VKLEKLKRNVLTFYVCSVVEGTAGGNLME